MQDDLISEKTTAQDIVFMQRCLFLAQKGLGQTYPNPLVGCVIVHQNKIIAEGWHQKAGGLHAEAMAIEAVENKNLLKKSTLYVNLEPCAHHGKTPPCANLIVKHKIPKIVIATLDPHKVVAGKGVKILKQAGCKIILNVLHKEASFLNRRFFTFHQQQRPYVILKWAQTQDHFISPTKKESDLGSVFWITETLAQQRSHQWRSEEQAIMVGIQTVVDDDPQLTNRHWKGNNPIRFIIDPQGRIPEKSKIMTDPYPSYFLNKNKGFDARNNKVSLKTDFTNCQTLLQTLFKMQIQSVIVEGGKTTLSSFLKEKICDEIRIFENPKKLRSGIPAPKLNKPPAKKEKLGSDTLTVFYF